MLQMWVGTSYATYHDTRRHTGGVMSMGQVIIHGKSSTQKINTNSSTETELVRASHYITDGMGKEVLGGTGVQPRNKYILSRQ